MISNSKSYQLTIAKLKETMAVVNEDIKEGNYTKSLELVKLFKDYENCFYCQDYRKILKDHYKGCCGNCPLHRYGQKMIGREIAYNGCYKIACYREVVRLSWEFCTEPNEILAKQLIKNMEECLNQLTIHKSEVEF